MTSAAAAWAGGGAARGTIGGRRFDLVFFFGSGLFAALIGALCLARPVLVVPLYWAFLVFVEGPHLVATWARTYLDPGERARRGRLLAWSLVLLVPGIAAWGAARALGRREPMDLFLLVATLWSFHHGVRQLHGVLAIWHHHARSPFGVRKVDRLFLHGALWAAFGIFSIGHPANRALLGLTSPPPRFLSWLGFGLFGVLVGYGLVRRFRQGRGVDSRPLLFLLGPALGLELYSMFVIGAFEPLVPRPEDPEQAFLTTAMVAGIVHGMNYLGIVAAVGKRRYNASEERSLAATFGRRPLLAYGIFALVSLLYLGVNALRGVLPGINIYPRGGAAADLFVVLYWGVFFHHYYIDQKIWHVREDKQLRYELGLEAAS